MHQILEIIDNNDLSNEAKCVEISRTAKFLSANGRGKELLARFFKMTGINASSAFLGATNSKVQSILANGRVYTFGEVIEESSRASVNTLNSNRESQDGHGLNVKIFKHRESRRNPLDLYNDRKYQLEVFEDVYNLLGPKFLPNFQDLPKTFDYHLGQYASGEIYNFQIFPKLRGIPISDYINQKHRDSTYNELEMFAACADFLYDLHCIEVIHEDIIAEKIIVVNELGGVFFIDYKNAQFKNDLSLKDWQMGVLKDVAGIITAPYIVRCESNLPVNPLNLLQVADAMKLRRWFTNIDIVNNDIGYRIRGCFDKLIELCNQTVIFYNQGGGDLFQKDSVKATIKRYEREFGK